MQNTFKLSRKFVLLAVMLLGTSFAVFTDTNASTVMPCCSDCEAIYQDCINNGGTPAECFQQSRSCFRRCSFDC